MAKSARSSTVKANNQRLKKGVFGPVEAARQERLSAKLLEIASQPKPVQEQKMEDVAEKAMDIDTSADAQTKPRKSRIIRRRGKKSNIVFPKFGDRNKVKKR
ncbi:major facilitator superfamily transporter protein [Cytospora paraplurivora]|uniref:Major facilitator superfamily transporter protein n=1 Tax=Cytospora paraplurivora TaxID=2898453 RepID=A0AAN9U5Q6_9PEZI